MYIKQFGSNANNETGHNKFHKHNLEDTQRLLLILLNIQSLNGNIPDLLTETRPIRININFDTLNIKIY